MNDSYKTKFGDWLHAQLCKVFGEPDMEVVTDSEQIQKLDEKFAK